MKMPTIWNISAGSVHQTRLLAREGLGGLSRAATM